MGSNPRSPIGHRLKKLVSTLIPFLVIHMNSLMNLLLLLLFSWLVVRHMQAQILEEQNPAEETDLVERDLQQVAAIAATGFGYLQRFVAIGFGFLRGLADMTAALLLAVWKMLNAQQTKSYKGRLLFAASALGRMLRGFALRMRKGNFSRFSRPLISPEISPEGRITVDEDCSLTPFRGGAYLTVLSGPTGAGRSDSTAGIMSLYRGAPLIPISLSATKPSPAAAEDVQSACEPPVEAGAEQHFEPAFEGEPVDSDGDQAPSDSGELEAVACMGDLLPWNKARQDKVNELVSKISVGTEPETVGDPVDASVAVVDVRCAPCIDPDQEAIEYVAALRKGYADGSAVGSSSVSEATIQPPLPGGASDCGGLPVVNAESNLGPIEFTEADAETAAVEPSQLPELGFGAAAKPAQELAKQGNRKRKAGAAQAAGRNAPDSVQRSARQLPRQDAGARRPSLGGRRGNR